jgi:hypothetical protein
MLPLTPRDQAYEPPSLCNKGKQANEHIFVLIQPLETELMSHTAPIKHMIIA